MHVVICGAGVIGACTAYFLARRGIQVTVIERTDVACAASGKAGGFLALDWCAASPLDELARRSFVLHGELAGEIGDELGYQRTSAYAGVIARESSARTRRSMSLDWLSAGTVISNRIGTPDTTAVVNPRKFTTTMMQRAQEHGAQVRLGIVTGVARGHDGSKLAGVEVDGSVIEADATVVAMGPWSQLAAKWLPFPRVFGELSPSIVYDTGTDVSADALFLEYRHASGEVTLEVFPRGDGTTHVCAFSGNAPLPDDPADVAPESGVIDRLHALCERLSPAFREDRIVAKQACFRPVARDYVPLIGRVAGTEGAYVATGHNVWGILNAPATGEAMAELIVDGEARTVDLTPFDPRRFG